MEPDITIIYENVNNILQNCSYNIEYIKYNIGRSNIYYLFKSFQMNLYLER